MKLLKNLWVAHRNKDLILENVRKSISENLEFFKSMSSEEIFNDRKNKFLKIGRNKGFINNLEDLSSLKDNNKLEKIYKSKKFIIFTTGIVLLMMILLTFIL